MKKLSLFKTDNTDFFYTKDSLISSEDDELARVMEVPRGERESDYILEIMLGPITKNFTEQNPIYIELLELNARTFKLPKKNAVLHAHGYTINGKWKYHADDNKDYLIQRWINEHDGQYSGLFLCTCNPEQEKIHSKKSAILVPNHFYNQTWQDNHLVKIELFLPKIGYVNDYETEAHVLDFKRALKNRE